MQPRAGLPTSLSTFKRDSNRIGGGTTTGVMEALARTGFGLPKEVTADKNSFRKMIVANAPAAAATLAAQQHEAASYLVGTINEIKSYISKLQERTNDKDTRGMGEYYAKQLSEEEKKALQLIEQKKLLLQEIRQLKEKSNTEFPKLGTDLAAAKENQKTHSKISELLNQFQIRGKDLGKQLKDIIMEERLLQKILNGLRESTSTRLKVAGLQQQVTTQFTTATPASNTANDSDLKKLK